MYEDSAIHRETRTKLALLLLLLLVECLLSPKLTRREEGIFSPTDCFVAVGVSVILVSRVIKFPIGPINFAKLKSNYRARGIPARFERIRDKGPRREGESFHPDRIRLGRSPWNRVKGISIPRVWGSETNARKRLVTKTTEYMLSRAFLKLKRNDTRYTCATLCLNATYCKKIVSLVHSRNVFD